MRYGAILLFSALFLFACTKKEDPAPVPMTQPTLPAAIDEVDKALEKELTDADFQKGKGLHGIVMKSLVSGRTINFAAYKGKKIIVDFWSSWCIPCIEMFPDIEKIKKEYEDEKGTVKVISISVDPMPGKVIEIAKEKGISFEVIQAPESLQNAGILLPFTAFADENGVVTATTNGKHSFAEIKKMAGLN